jgi:carbamoylphosphate synthase large subunit
MAKVLLVDTNVSSSPIYKFLLRDGHQVAVIGGNKNDYLARSTPWYIEADYSDHDLLESIVNEYDFDYVVPGCNDRSYHACAELNSLGSFSGIDSLEVTETINNKQLFRAFAEACEIPVPKVYDSESCPLNHALIVKPVDAFSGRGVSILQEPTTARLSDAMDYARSVSRSSSCIIEDYVTGQLYSHSCFIQRNKVLFEFVVEEHSTANPFVVDTSRVVFDFSPKMLEKLRFHIEEMAHALNLVDGLIHTQFMFNGVDIWFIEVTRRCPGDLYSQLIEMSTGVPYAEFYARPFLSLPLPKLFSQNTKDLILRHTMSLSVEVGLEHLRFNVPILLERMYPMAMIGDRIQQSPFSRVALIFVRASSQTELDQLFERTLRRELYSVEQ